jgi:hypothetical protein
MSHGGKRQNSGPKKGTKYAPAIAKEQAREVARGLITAQLQPMIEAQVANALGIKYLVTRDKKTGKFIRVTEAMARKKSELAENEEIVEVWEKDPNVQAFTDLMNRALDKPKEQEQALKLSGAVDIVTLLRRRYAKHQKPAAE